MPAQAAQLAEVTVREDDVLLNITGASIGRVTLAPARMDGARVNQHVCIIRLLPGVLPTFVSRFLASPEIQHKINTEEYGVTRQALTKGGILNFEIPVPPLSEQRRVVAKVEELLAQVNLARERLAKVPKILKRFRQAVLAAACDGRLTADWREGDGEEVGNGEDLPSTWKRSELREICTDFQYGTSAKSQKQGNVPVLRMGNIQEGKLDWSDLVFTSDRAEIKKYALSPNTVLFNRTNSPELVGKTALFRGERTAIFAGYLIRVIPGADLDPEYLNLSLNTSAFKEYCHEVKTDGVSQSNINAQKLADYGINWCPLPEQHEIVRRVDALFALADKIEARVQAAWARVERITQAILAKAFRGELVPTEAELARQEGRDYEPAARLLERVRVKQAAGENGRLVKGLKGKGRKNVS